MEKARIHMFVSGKVQGVFFRAEAQQRARELKLTGWVQNLHDGRVELVAEGEKEKVEQLVAWCRKGPPLARVEDCDIQHENHKGEFQDFSVRELAHGLP